MIEEKRQFYQYLYKIKNYKYVCKKLSLYKQHGKTSVLKHSRNVAYISYILAKKISKISKILFNYEYLVIGAFLHDLFLYDWHEKINRHGLHAFTHPIEASKNAKQLCNINKSEQKIIESHMWPLTITRVPKTKEAMMVCVVDKYCAIVETLNR